MVYQDYTPLPSMRGPDDANPLLTAPKYGVMNNAIVNNISIQHTNGYGNNLAKEQQEF